MAKTQKEINLMSESRRFVILTEGHTEPHRAKTASCMIRYRANEVSAILDSTQAGNTSRTLLGVGDVPIVASLAEAHDANTLLIGIAPAGGKIPPAWRAVISEAMARGMNVVSGLHEFISDDPEFAAEADTHGVTITDLRENVEKEVARRIGLREDCLRIHTVGHDCSIGKMVTSKEIADGLIRNGHDAKFLATGQTGILLEGDGVPIDCVVADFVSGAIEKLVKKYQHHDILVIEGQGSLVHPSYSGVTLGLLHGCLPHALILCYEIGRDRVTGIEHLKIPPLVEIKRMNEMMASVSQPCPVIGISMNGRKVSGDEIDAERKRVKSEFGLPACDVIRHGPDELADAVIRFHQGGQWQSQAS